MMQACIPASGPKAGTVAQFIHGYFAWLDERGVKAALLHGWIEGFEGSVSDVDHVVEPTGFARIAQLIADYCSDCGWLLCQVIRHESTAAYCICACPENPSLTVALDACSDYRARGALWIHADDLLRDRVPMENGGWRVSDTTGLAYRLIKGAVKSKEPHLFAEESARFSEAARRGAAELARLHWNITVEDWSAESIRKTWLQLEQGMNQLPGESRCRHVLRVLKRLIHPTGLVLHGGRPSAGAVEACGQTLFRRSSVAAVWRIRDFGRLASSTLTHAERIGRPWCRILPASWKLTGIDGESHAQLHERLVAHLSARCIRRETLAPRVLRVGTPGHGNPRDRPRVLMSAFACEPNRGSEQEVGWRWAVEMARWFDVTVITQTRNRKGIELELQRHGLPSDRTLGFVYFQLPGPLQRLKSRFDPLTWPYYALWQCRMIRVARRMHRAEPFDLAHHVTFVSFRVPVWLKRLGVPVVFGPVGGAERAPWPLLMHGFGALSLMKEVLRNASRSVCAFNTRIMKPIAPGHGMCLAATPAMAEIFKRAGLPARILPAIGMDVTGDENPPSATSESGLRLLYVGRFHPLKGVGLLLEAFATANLPRCTLTLVGAGPEENHLRRLAKRLGIEDRIEWRGKIPRNELPDCYRAHHLLLAPSLYESGGLAALEAMSEGLPVIALDVGGHSLSVADDCGIRIAASGTAHEVIGALAAAMRRYADSPGLLKEHGEAARRRVREEYSWDHKANRMRSIYLGLLAARR